MSPGFSRRLVLFSTLALAAVLASLIAVTALLAFGSFVGGLRARIADEVSDVRAYVAVHGNPASAQSLGTAIAERFFHPDLLVTVLDANQRVTVRSRSVASSRLRLSNVAIDVAQRSAIPQTPPRGTATRISLALATLFGLTSERAQFGDVDIIVRADEAAVTEVVNRFAPGFALAEVLACLAAFLLARVLTFRALRPLVAVNAALERFASGDLTPQLVTAENQGELGALARAYNGAIAQMALAFAERERAQAAMHQFISDAGHQLKTPLTVIRGFISVLRKGGLRSADDYERILEKMSRQSHVMGELIEKLILLESWEHNDEHSENGAIDIAQLVEDVVSPLAEAQPHRRIVLEIASACAAIDPSGLAHAVTNLVDNALKYTGARFGYE